MASFYALIILSFICPVSGGLIILLYNKKKEKRIKKISILLIHSSVSLGAFVGAWFSAKNFGHYYPINYLFLVIIVLLAVLEFTYCIFSKSIYKK